MNTIDTTNMCSHLQRKLFEEDGAREGTSNEWCEPVDDANYDALK